MLNIDSNHVLAYITPSKAYASVKGNKTILSIHQSRIIALTRVAMKSTWAKRSPALWSQPQSKKTDEDYCTWDKVLIAFVLRLLYWLKKYVCTVRLNQSSLIAEHSQKMRVDGKAELPVLPFISPPKTPYGDVKADSQRNMNFDFVTFRPM